MANFLLRMRSALSSVLELGIDGAIDNIALSI